MDTESQHPDVQRPTAWRKLVPRWSDLRALGESKILRSSYVWFVVVPVAARFVETVRSPLDMTIFGAEVTFNIDLPFSWKAFFFASVLFTIASLIYEMVCPNFVKEQKDLGEFTSKGKGLRHILVEAKRVEQRTRDVGAREKFVRDIKRWTTDRDGRVIETEEGRHGAFWRLHEHLNSDHCAIRVLLTCLYFAGFAFIAVVVLQNIYYVVRL